MSMEYKSSLSFTKIEDDTTVRGFAAIIGNVDSGGDRIMRGAFKKTLQENIHRIKHLWQHNYDQPPIAVVKDLREVNKNEMPQELLEANPDIAGGLLVVRKYLDTERAREIYEGIRNGAITEMSIGFEPIKQDFSTINVGDGTMLVRNLREVRLWDISDVNWGMNANTVAYTKTAVPYRSTGRASEDEDWSAPSLSDFGVDSFDDLSDAQKTRIMAHYAFTTNMPPETFGDLKLPHHKPSTSGVGVIVWRGVVAAMAALMGARGGVDIPDSDRRAVYNHLAKHYDEFGKEPPDYKFVQLFSCVRDIRSANIAIGKLADILGQLEQYLCVETHREEYALTQSLLTRLEIARRYILVR